MLREIFVENQLLCNIVQQRVVKNAFCSVLDSCFGEFGCLWWW